MSIKPTQDRVIVKPLEPETTTSSGLVIPTTTTLAYKQGTVLAVGPGRKTRDGVLIEPQVQQDQVVLWPTHTGQTVKVDGQELVILREEEILAIVE